MACTPSNCCSSHAADAPVFKNLGPTCSSSWLSNPVCCLTLGCCCCPAAAPFACLTGNTSAAADSQCCFCSRRRCRPQGLERGTSRMSKEPGSGRRFRRISGYRFSSAYAADPQQRLTESILISTIHAQQLLAGEPAPCTCMPSALASKVQHGPQDSHRHECLDSPHAAASPLDPSC
jgi:hypothetical protein